MKAKLAIAIVVGLVACNAVVGQNSGDTPPANAPTPAASPADAAQTTPAAAPAETAQTPPAAAPAGQAQTPPAAPPATDAAPAAAPAAATPAADTPATTPPVASTTAANGVAAAPGAVIPLIQFQGVPLTTAIENLARQANLNYILDPKVGYGQPNEKGVVVPEPNISVRWENLTAEQALSGLLNTYGLQVVEDPKTKISKITVRDPAAAEPLFNKVIQLKFASPSNVVQAVQTVLTDKRSKVVPDTRTSQLVITATEKELVAVDQLVANLDLQTKQVLIEAKILETTLSPRSDKGIDWSGTLANQKFSFGNNQRILPITESVAPIHPVDPIPKMIYGLHGTPATAFLNADGVSAALSFLNTSSDTKVVSEPRMVTLDNQKASIDVGLLFPIVNTTAGTANTTGGSQISYSNLTVNLDVTPRIAANNFIELKVQQGVMRLGPDFNSTVGGVNNVVNSFLTRRLDTSVLIPSGNTLVMGGLIQDTTGNSNTKVPVLGDIPGVGLLFRKDSKSLDRQNLIIFITPTVVVDSDFQPTQTTYLKTTGTEEISEDWSAWDSGKPSNWKKMKSSGGGK